MLTLAAVRHIQQSSKGEVRMSRAAWRWRRAACVLALLALAPALLMALGTGKPLREYGQQGWQSDSGLPQNTVHALAQTRDGYLWIGTEGGLVRFDGMDFRVFDTENTPALHSNTVNGLAEDGAGALWISTPAGLVREQGGAFVAYGSAEGLPVDAALGLYQTHAGQLLVLTPGGAAVLSGGRFQLIRASQQLGLAEGESLVAESPTGQVWLAGPSGVMALGPHLEGTTMPHQVGVGELHAIAATPGGGIWAGGAAGLAMLAGDGQIQMARSDLPSRNVTALLATGGDVWVGTAKGLVRMTEGATRALPEFAGLRIERIFQDRAGTVWVATIDGLARIEQGKVDLAPPRGMPGGALSVLEDREGSMWFGTETAGLHVLRDQPFSTLRVEDGLSARLVRAVLEDRAETMWVGTSGGGLDRVAGGVVSVFPAALPSRVILALAETGNAAQGYELWVGTPEGLVQIHDGKPRVFTTADGLADDFVRSLYADRDGSLWVGTRNGLTHVKDGRFRSYSRLDGLASDLIGAMLRGRDGTLWVGTLGGLSRMAGDGFVDAGPGVRAGQGSVAVTALLEDASGTLWVGTQGSGLGRLRGGMLTSLAGRDRRLPSTIYGMLEDAGGALWLSSRTGVDRVSVAGLEALADGAHAPLQVAHFDASDGMSLPEASGGGHPAAWRARDGRLWFATLDGVAVVDPGTAMRQGVAPLVSLEQVAVDEQPVALGEKPVRVEPGHGRLTIRYAGLTFVPPQKVRYRYMLAGLDKQWINAGSRRTAYYTNVPPGHYRFRVMAANGDGMWSAAPAEVSFVVEPYAYQTWWFYTLAAVTLAALGYLVYRWRVHTVEAQYQAVLGERGRIAREIHDTLAQGYVAVAVQLELTERLLGASVEAAAEQLRQTKELVRASLAEARSSIWNLRAQTDAATLPSHLAAHVAAVARRSGLAADLALKFAVHGAYQPLVRGVEEELLRIAQEAVANAVAHAQASLVRVSLNYDPHMLELVVSDDGSGLPQDAETATRRGHFGLQGMRERAERIGAVLAVEGRDAERRGTVVRLQLDLRRVKREAL